MERARRWEPERGKKRNDMGLILVVLLLALVFGGLGFVYPLFWIVAVLLFVFWIIGFALGKGRKAARA
jgi:hypothetical protein